MLKFLEQPHLLKHDSVNHVQDLLDSLQSSAVSF